MKRSAKPEGKFNVVIEEVPIPEPGPEQVRIRSVTSLISRGSEIGARYTREHAVNPESMGYSLAGVVDAVGAEVTHLRPGDRVVSLAPHAEYVVRDAVYARPDAQNQVYPIADGVSFEQATYWPLLAGGVTWVDIEELARDDLVVVVGQGLVGSLIMQVQKLNGTGTIVAIDTLDLRCEMAAKLGADIVINAAKEDAVAAVRRLSNGVGADTVVYAVGGSAGPKAFGPAMDMVARGGTLHLVGLYEDQPLPLTSGAAQGSADHRRLLPARPRRGVGATRHGSARIGPGRTRAHDDPPLSVRAGRRRVRSPLQPDRRDPGRRVGVRLQGVAGYPSAPASAPSPVGSGLG